MSKPDTDLWLNIWNLQLYEAISLEYVREVSGLEYGIKNYDDEVKCEYEARHKSCERIKKHLIVGLKKYNI